MIWDRLHKYAQEQERRQEEEQRAGMEKPHVGLGEGCLMTLVAYGMLLVPAVAVLGGLSLLLLWMFGML